MPTNSSVFGGVSPAKHLPSPTPWSCVKEWSSTHSKNWLDCLRPAVLLLLLDTKVLSYSTSNIPIKSQPYNCMQTSNCSCLFSIVTLQRYLVLKIPQDVWELPPHHVTLLLLPYFSAYIWGGFPSAVFIRGSLLSISLHLPLASSPFTYFILGIVTSSLSLFSPHWSAYWQIYFWVNLGWWNPSPPRSS